jgi:MutS domain V
MQKLESILRLTDRPRIEDQLTPIPISLVIIDELGRSAAVIYSFSIAFAVAEYLASIPNWLSMFVTHFAAMRALKYIPVVVTFHRMPSHERCTTCSGLKPLFAKDTHDHQDARRIQAALPERQLVLPQSFRSYVVHDIAIHPIKDVFTIQLLSHNNSLTRAMRHLEKSAVRQYLKSLEAQIRAAAGSVHVDSDSEDVAEHSATQDYLVTQSKGTNRI